MCPTFFEIFRFFYGITRVFPENCYLCDMKSFLRIMHKFKKVVTVIMLAVTLCFTAGCTKDNGGNGSYNGHDYVDLGLPSGTMWATCNVGAESPDQYGDYFAWGETTPKTTYNWSTYKYCNGDYNLLTKYCPQSDFGFNGFTDDFVTLQPNDDAATVNWGEGWSTPTYKQWVELLSKCSHTWTTRNGVNGCLFTARNGNSIFLPAGDSRYDEESRLIGDEGSYWSSTLHQYMPDGVKGFQFIISFEDCDLYDTFCRASGRPVRAVCSAR